MLAFKTLFRESFSNTALAIGEDLSQIRANEDSIDQGTTAYRVINDVVNFRSTIHLLERVGVLPSPIRAFQLPVDKLERRLPGDDLGAPAKGDSTQS